MAAIEPTPVPTGDNPIIATPPVVEAPPAPPAPPAIPEGYYPREEVEKLRKENQAYRERFQPYERTFGEFDDETREAWLNIARMSQDNDPDLRAELAKQLNYQLPPDETPEYLTKAEAEALFAERQQQAETAQHLARFFEEADTLGYKQNTPDLARLMGFVNLMDTPSVAEAHKLIQAEDQKKIQDFIAKKAQQSEESIQQSDSPSIPARAAMEIKGLKDARKAAEARFAGLRDQ